MKLKLLICALGLSTLTVNAQSVPRAFEDWKTAEGTQNFFYKNVTKTDGAGNVVVAGATMANGAPDILVAKYNSKGVQLWIQQFSGLAAAGVDFAAGLYVTDTHVYLTGAVTNNTTTPETDCFTMKLSTTTGSIVWNTTYSGAAGYIDGGKFVTVDGSGDVYVTGTTYNSGGNADYLTLKYNGTTGAQTWVNTWGYSSGLDDAGVKLQLSGSNVVVAGAVTSTTNNYKVATITMSQSTGVNSATNVAAAITTSSVDAVVDMTTDAANNIIIIGSQYVSGQGNNIYCQKVAGGTLVSAWTYTYNGSSNLDDYGKAVYTDASNNVFIAGSTKTSTLGKDIIMVKLNASGAVQNTVTSGFAGDDEAVDMIIDASNNVYLTGYKTNATYHDKNYYTVKYSNSCAKTWEIETDGTSYDDNGTNLTLDSLNNVIVTGQSETSPAVYRFLTTKYVQYDVTPPIDLTTTTNDKSFLFYQNIGQELSESLTQIPSKKFVTNTSPKYYFTGNGLSMVFASAHADSNRVDTIHKIDLSFQKSNSDAKIFADEDFGVNITYILGQLSKPIVASKGKQRLFVPELYTGIDLHYYSNKNGGLKYYFIVKPGADPSNIKQYFNSTSYTTTINGSNQLDVISSVGKITLSQPLAYQLNTSGVPVAISGSSYWHSSVTNSYDFTLPTYTNTMTLIVMVNQVSKQSTVNTVGLGNLGWSTFVGGGDDDQSWAVTTDASDNQYIAGATSSINYPTTGFQVVRTGSVFTNNRYGFLQKFNAQHDLRLSAYIGGNDQTDAFDVETNSLGDVYVVGTTSATNFLTFKETGAFNDSVQGSTAVGASQDCFIVKFNSTNQYTWGTLFGGTNNDNALSCTVDNSNNLYVIGTSGNGSLPLVPNGSAHQQSWAGSQDGYIARFGNNNALNWFTFIGGSNVDYLYSAKTDASGNLYLSGASYSSNFPIFRANSGFYQDNTLGGSYDMVMLKFDQNGVRQWSSYFGGSSEEGSLYYPTHKGIALDNSQNLYFADNTTSSDLFTKRSGSTCYYDSTFGGRIDGFILKFNSSLVPQYCTYVGDTDYDYAHAINFDSNNNLYLSFGTSNATIGTRTLGNYYNQPTMRNTGTATYAADNFLLSLYSNLNPRWATFFGGSSYNAQGDEGTDIAIKGNNMYLTGYCNSYPANPSTDVRFPIFYPGSPAYIDSTYNDATQANKADAFISLFDLSQSVGIEDLNSGNNLGSSAVLYPNPTNNVLNVKFNSSKQEKVNLRIFGIDGKLVFETLYPTVEGTNLMQFNTTNLAEGMYILKIEGNDYSIKEKFVKYE